VEPTIVALHVENEVDETGRPIPETAVPGITVEIEKQHDGARRVVDAGDPLEAAVARVETTARRPTAETRRVSRASCLIIAARARGS
jgi:hypothetical protein